MATRPYGLYPYSAGVYGLPTYVDAAASAAATTTSTASAMVSAAGVASNDSTSASTASAEQIFLGQASAASTTESQAAGENIGQPSAIAASSSEATASAQRVAESGAQVDSLSGNFATGNIMVAGQGEASSASTSECVAQITAEGKFNGFQSSISGGIIATLRVRTVNATAGAVSDQLSAANVSGVLIPFPAPSVSEGEATGRIVWQDEVDVDPEVWVDNPGAEAVWVGAIEGADEWQELGANGLPKAA